MKFSISNVLGHCLAAIASTFWQLVAISAIWYFGLLALVCFLIFGMINVKVGAEAPIAMIPLIVLSYLGWTAHWCSVAEIMLRKAANRPLQIGTILQRGFLNAFPVLLVGLLWLLGTVVGETLLIIPGVIFAVIFQVAVPSYIEDKVGVFGAFSRSRALTKGHRWRLFALNLIVGILLLVIAGVLVGLAGSAALADNPADGAFSPVALLLSIFVWFVAGPALMVFTAAVNTWTYIALRADKGELLAGSVAKIFE